ncbi:MAG: HesA/MoeB/ThiF family protein [archaeon]|nr:HesA/MoeB/ThiF family protein [Nanoarchaeota archaeon]
MLTKQEQEMYSRQTILKEIGPIGQELIQQAKITIIGVGALGTGTAELLIRAGIKNLIIIDNDTIELSNLQRQNLFDQENLNKPKVTIAKNKLFKINPYAKIIAHNTTLNNENIKELIPTNIDLILDSTDNMETRFLLDNYCKNNNIKWVFASAAGTKGMLAAIFPEGPRLADFLPNNAQGETSCSMGVLNTVTRIISAMQTTLALKIITNNQVNYNELTTYDAWNNEINKLKIKN